MARGPGGRNRGRRLCPGGYAVLRADVRLGGGQRGHRRSIHRAHSRGRSGPRPRTSPTGPEGIPHPEAVPAHARHLLPVLFDADHHLQGHAHHGSARAVLPRPVRSAVLHATGDRALEVLHEHLPFVAPRAAFPDHRPQWRNQYGQGQPELDESPPVAVEVTAARPAPPTRSHSTRWPNRSCSRAARCPRRS